MKARFIRGGDPKNTLRIGIKSILWNADLDEEDTEEVVYLYDEMNDIDPELGKLLEYYISLGDIIKKGESNEVKEKTLIKTEFGFILINESDYGKAYFCHVSTLPEIEKRLGRKRIIQ